MKIIVLVILFVVIAGFIGLQFINNNYQKHPYITLLKLGYICIIINIIVIIFINYSYREIKNIKGAKGPKGLRGVRGHQGKYASCAVCSRPPPPSIGSKYIEDIKDTVIIEKPLLPDRNLQNNWNNFYGIPVNIFSRRSRKMLLSNVYIVRINEQTYIFNSRNKGLSIDLETYNRKTKARFVSENYMPIKIIGQPDNFELLASSLNNNKISCNLQFPSVFECVGNKANLYVVPFS